MGLAGLSGTANAQTGNLVANGGFEAPAVSGKSQVLAAGDTTLAGWTIGGNSISLIGGFWQPQEGAQSIDLNGSGAGSIAQSIGTTAGTYYKLRFYFSGHPDLGGNPARMTVRWNSAGGSPYSEQFTWVGASSKSNMNWQLVERVVQAGSATSALSFTSDTPQNQNYGVALDGVSVTPLPPQAPLSITGPLSLAYGATGTVTTSGGSSTGALTFSAGTSTGCTVDANSGLVTVINASGTCVLTATKANDDNYGPATSPPFSMTLIKAVAVVTLSGLTRTYTGSALTPTSATTPPNLGITWTNAPQTAAGTYAVTATVNDPNYQGSAGGSFVIGKAAATVTLGNLTQTYTGSALTPTAATTPPNLSIVWTNAPQTAAGTYAVTAAVNDANYQGSANGSFVVSQAGQAPFSVAAPASLTYGTTGTVAVSGGSGTGAVAISAGASTGCAVDAVARTVTVTDASGTCSITATKAGDGNYLAASATASVALLKASQATLSITGPASLAYGAPGTVTTSGGSGNGALAVSAGTSTGCAVDGTSVTVTDAGNTSCTLVATKAGDNNYFDATSAPFGVTLPAPFPTPVLVRAISTGDSGVYVVGRLDGGVGIAGTLQIYSASGCTDAQLEGGGTAVGGTLAFTPDSYGYFSAQLASGVTPGAFVALRITSPDQTPMSACLVSSGDNDNWPKALQLGVAGASPTTPLVARDYLDAPGRARWYKFDVLPGQRISVSLAGLPADYDLAVFKDIGATFLKLLGLADDGRPHPAVRRIRAVDVQPVDVQPVDVQSVDVQPRCVRAGGVRAVDVQPERVLAVDVQPVDVLAVDVQPVDVLAFDVLARRRSRPRRSARRRSARRRSRRRRSRRRRSARPISRWRSRARRRAASSASRPRPASATSSVVVNSWNNTGSFYVRVAGRGGAYSTGSQFQVDIQRSETGCANVIDPKVAVPRPPARLERRARRRRASAR